MRGMDSLNLSLESALFDLESANVRSLGFGRLVCRKRGVAVASNPS